MKAEFPWYVAVLIVAVCFLAILATLYAGYTIDWSDDRLELRKSGEPSSEETVELERLNQLNISSNAMCGVINSIRAAEEDFFDYGKAIRMAASSNCNDICGSSDLDTRMCTGFLMISNDGTQITGQSCDYNVPERYIERGDHIACCCR